MQLTIDQLGKETYVAHIQGHLSDINAGRLVPDMIKGSIHAKTLILDLHNLEYITSAGVMALLKLRKEFISKGRNLFITKPRGLVRSIMSVFEVETLFELVSPSLINRLNLDPVE